MHGAKRRAALAKAMPGRKAVAMPGKPSEGLRANRTVTNKGENHMENRLPWEIETIINVAVCLKATGSTGASTGEQIAAAFVLNRPDYLPVMYADMVEAWDRLDEQWQAYVRLIKREYMHLID
jgi:hypothetical protein